MHSSQFQALNKTLKSTNISEFIKLFDKFTENIPSHLTDSENYDKFSSSLERTYYSALSKCLTSSRFDDFIQLIKYSDKLGIFMDVSNIDIAGIITKLHIEGLNNQDRGRIIELVRFFNEYNLFERNFTTEELKTIREIKENYKLLVINLKDLFGNVSDSLIYYVCKMMPHDYLVWLNQNYHEGGFVMDPYSLRNWTDGFSIYGLIVRNLGRIEDFIKAVETMQNSDNMKGDILYLEFNPRYIIRVNENRILHEFREIHLIHPVNVLQNKKKILNKDNYTFYSLSMVIFGGLGPEGFGFTYSTPKGEVIEICSDQRETEAIIIQFKQYIKRKFLTKLVKEMERLGIKTNIIKGISSYLSEILNPEDLVSYNNIDSILKNIENLLEHEFQEYIFEIDKIMSKISKVFSKIYNRKIKIWYKLFFKRRVLGRLEKEITNLDVNGDISRRIKKFLVDSINPKDFFKYHNDNSITDVINKLLLDEFQQLNEDLINKIAKAVSVILRPIKLEDQFRARMDLVVKGKLRSEDIAKLTSLRGKSHYDVLRERIFLQNKPYWFYKNYPEEIEELQKEFLKIVKRERLGYGLNSD